MQDLAQQLTTVLQQVSGYIYPNEVELQWGLLVVVYPYITGLVAGAFILASLERVFNVKEVEPTYRLALLTALAFLLIAPLPLLLHLGHPERSFEIFLTPNMHSAMAMFGFVYAWYLTVVLLLEIWFHYRKDLVLWAQNERGLRKWIHLILTLGATDISEKSVAFDQKAVRFITIIGIPSAFLLHGYVGFIFGSVKANPWWSSVLMPVVFLFSAIVSGIALVLILYEGVRALVVLNSRLSSNNLALKRGLVALAVFAFSLLFMVGDKERFLLKQDHQLQPTDEVIAELAQLTGASNKPMLVASQWPGRTMLATRSGALPLPPVHKDDPEAFLRQMRGVTYMAFDQNDNRNRMLRREVAELSDRVKTVSILNGGVIVQFPSADNDKKK